MNEPRRDRRATVAEIEGQDRLSVTVLGLGALGSAMARAFLDADYQVTVWNRTGERAHPLVNAGAVPARDVAAAVSSSRLVIVCVSLYEDARQVLEQAGGELAGRTIANLGSGTADQAHAMAAWVTDSGAGYLDGAAMSGTRLVGRPDALFLYSGPEATFARHHGALAVLGRAVHLADDPGAASLHDTALLTLNLGLLAGFYQASAIVGTGGVKAADLARIAVDYLPFTIALLADHAGHIDAHRYPSDDGTLRVYADAVDHVLATSGELELGTDLPAAIHSMLTKAIDAGWQEDGLARLVDVIRPDERPSQA